MERIINTVLIQRICLRKKNRKLCWYRWVEWKIFKYRCAFQFSSTISVYFQIALFLDAVDAPVYLFRCSGKHDKQDSRMWEQEIKEITSIVDVSMENANQLLQAPDMHQICLDVPHRASECCLAAQNAVQACARIAEEHRLMLQVLYSITVAFFWRNLAFSLSILTFLWLGGTSEQYGLVCGLTEETSIATLAANGEGTCNLFSGVTAFTFETNVNLLITTHSISVHNCYFHKTLLRNGFLSILSVA
ncbi:unnamed protein product [Haemonchus placei]|uniref:GPS domain-containing protein n=1 Tax=Haemonchus placei TaxID=6290 RepID=A0A0N4VSA6_HAEPC|nr:unnamed protein product [Haemonchus placei]